MKQPNYRKDALKLMANFKASKDEDGTTEARSIEMTPERCLQILRAISDDDLISMGLSPEFARPEWMLITILPVPPMPVRPSISVDGMGRGEDDLTHKLADIIKANITLQRHETDGAPAHIIKELENLLQYHVGRDLFLIQSYLYG
jgi:DNA-directed RNA polymerase II subunit RPB1